MSDEEEEGKRLWSTGVLAHALRVCCACVARLWLTDVLAYALRVLCVCGIRAPCIAFKGRWQGAQVRILTVGCEGGVGRVGRFAFRLCRDVRRSVCTDAVSPTCSFAIGTRYSRCVALERNN